ncbi:MAG: cytochrome c1 [Rickettsiales bacterium]|nr:cytochrome c1 [Rickettsiales bacterium]
MRLNTIAACLLLSSAFVCAAHAETGVKHPKAIAWEFEGIFGKVDKASAQRGLQVFREVCSACHGVHRVAMRSLTELGFSEAEVKKLASEYTVKDGPDADGEMYERPGLPSDHFPSPYPNEQAARAANGGAYPPDLSLITKARHDGANYLHALLTGYEDAPADFVLPEGKYYNPYFPGGAIAMPQPIGSAGQVQYSDKTEASIDQMARDVTSFLQWAAEPEMEARKKMGIKVMIFLSILTVLLYFAKKRIWSRLKK